MTAGSSQRALMDGVYRYQRHVYDLSRRNYLLGRDRLLAELDPPPGGSVLELGCGTGRNLVALARRHPGVRLYGIDISTEMLRTARRTVARYGVYDRVRLAEADAVSIEPGSLFGIERFDRVFFSYTLSIIPDWRGALAKGASVLTPGGKLQFVDFGGCQGLPEVFETDSTSGWRFFTCRPVRHFPKNSQCWAVSLAFTSAVTISTEAMRLLAVSPFRTVEPKATIASVLWSRG